MKNEWVKAMNCSLERVLENTLSFHLKDVVIPCDPQRYHTEIDDLIPSAQLF